MASKKSWLGMLVMVLVLQTQTVFADAVIVVRCLDNPNIWSDVAGWVSIDGSEFRTLVENNYRSGRYDFNNIKNGSYVVTVKSRKWSGFNWKDAYSQTLRVEAYNNITYVSCAFNSIGKVLNFKVDKKEDIVDEFVSEYIGKNDAAGLSQYLQRNNLNLDEYINTRLSGGNTRLINEIRKNAVSLKNVKFLVENGANINLRNNNGETAASIAYDKGEIEIYNYLKGKGAVDFEPKQVAQQPAAPAPQTNVYVQPAAPPAQSSTPAPAPSTPTFQSGTYAFSGSNITMSLSGYQATAYSGYTQVAWGTYRINGNQLVITFITGNGAGASLQGKTFAYTITSNTSFSGGGETWVRTGY